MTPGASILIVEDEPRYVRLIRANLEASGYRVLAAADGPAAVQAAADENPDLILLDIRLPGQDGLEVCRRIREFSGAPIIFLTALTSEADKVRGLDLGADDYLTKPFGAGELMARVRAALRRGRAALPAGRAFQGGELRVDFDRQRVFVGEREIRLTPTEYRLLCELAREAGRILVPEVLLERAWGPGYAGQTKLVWQAVHRLRRKIERDPRAPQYIHSRRGVGYYLGPEQAGET